MVQFGACWTWWCTSSAAKAWWIRGSKSSLLPLVERVQVFNEDLLGLCWSISKRLQLSFVRRCEERSRGSLWKGGKLIRISCAQGEEGGTLCTHRSKWTCSSRLDRAPDPILIFVLHICSSISICNIDRSPCPSIQSGLHPLEHCVWRTLVISH